MFKICTFILVFKEIIIFIQQGLIKLIRSDCKVKKNEKIFHGFHKKY